MSAQVSTYFGLLAEFGAAEIPLDKIASKFFGLAPEKACRRAALNQLPVPAYRAGSQKSPWLISAADLAMYLDTKKAKARENWEKMNS